MSKKSIIYAFALFSLLTIFLISFASSIASEPSVWQQYGGELTKITHSQNPSSYSNIDNTTSLLVTNINGMTYDTSYPTQPLVTDFLNGGFTRLVIIQNGNFLQFFDKNLILISEIDTGGVLLGQMQNGDFNNDGLSNEIAGIYRINNTDIQLRYYQYNLTTNFLNLLSSADYSDVTTINTTGVRCVGGSQSFCAFVFGNATSTTIVKHFFNGTQYSNNTFGTLGFEVLALEDINNDNEYEGMAYDNSRVSVWNLIGGNIVGNLSNTASFSIDNARIVRVDGTPLYKIAVVEKSNTGSSFRVRVNRLDGSLLWMSSLTGVIQQIFGTGIYDYNNDGFDDIWVGYVDNSASKLKIYSGSTGTLLFDGNPYADMDDGTSMFGTQAFTIARMSSSSTPSIVFQQFGGKVIIFNPSIPPTRELFNMGTSGLSSCITADLNFDGQNDIICSKSGLTSVALTNSTNSNAVLNSVTFSPSTTIQVGNTLNALISCSDAEGDAIRYSSSCDTGTNFTESYSASRDCLYNNTGLYNLTLRCRDIYHDDYSLMSQIISVSQTGQTCNNNGICETGESNINCPNDCYVSGVNYTQTQGGMSLPTKLVDTTGNTETGLLPEIYYGTLAFFSNTMQPMIILIFLILSVFIILGIGMIIKRIVEKIKQL
jgi:hypothetical protein